MKKLALFALFLLPARTVTFAQAGQVPVPAVERMPSLPQPYVLRDWKKVARDFDAIAFDFQRTGQFLPLPWRDDGRVDHDITGFGLPAYVGDLRQSAKSNNYDAITCLGAVLGATLAGIDKSAQNGENWVDQLRIYYSHKNGTNLYLNNPGARSGQSFWYELLPSLLFYQIYDHYPSTPGFREQFLAIADRWYGGCVALGAGEKAPDFDHTAFDFAAGRPFDNPKWREPDAAAAVAWLEYMAFAHTNDGKYLQAAKWAMQFLTERQQNPFYEILMPYGAYVSARMNAEQGTDYPTAKFINWVFDGNNPREWGVIREKWGNAEVFGLQGSVHKGSEYAFTMNSFLAPSVMLPLVRYDDRYARAMGKWLLQVAVNARYLYPNAWKPEEQTSWDWAEAHDQNFAIAYEGLRKTGMQRDRPADFGGGRLKPSADGTIEKTWKIDFPNAEKRAFVVELKPRDGQADREIEVAVADSASGPWKPAFQFRPGDKNRKWLALKTGGPVWITLRAAPSAGPKPKPLVVEDVFVETRLPISPHASGDPLFHGWGQTDLGLYGSAFVGFLAAAVEPTNVEGILRLDCRATEAFAPKSLPTFLFYNPHAETKSVRFPIGPDAVDLYDTVQNRVIARNVRGEASFALNADTAAILVLCPAGKPLTQCGTQTLCGDAVIDFR
ncbi:MAG TPA: hypothetical protein PLS03_05770 [Terrimicrobiaceae bacterium]|nr:hypothetical protein [Terrimicrobiaceae bacterium]